MTYTHPIEATFIHLDNNCVAFRQRTRHLESGCNLSDKRRRFELNPIAESGLVSCRGTSLFILNRYTIITQSPCPTPEIMVAMARGMRGIEAAIAARHRTPIYLHGINLNMQFIWAQGLRR